MYYDEEPLIHNQSFQQSEVNNIIENSTQEQVEHGNTLQSRLPQYIATITASLSALSAGAVLAWTSPISIEIQNGTYNHISVDNYQMGWIGSFTTLGAFFFCLITGKICDAIGRKSTLILLIIPYGIGWTLILWADSLAVLYFGRFITGMAAGGSSIATPLYINEISQKEIRGRLGSYFQLMVTIGILYAYCFGEFLSIKNYTLMCSIAPAISVLLFIWQPETPLYYIKTNQHTKSISALQQLGRTQHIQIQIQEMENSLSTIDNSNPSLLDKKALKALFIVLTLMFFQQFGGINAIIFYTSDIFNQTHVKLDAKSSSIIVAVVQVLATFISSLVIDKVGRKTLLIGSTSIMSVSCFFLGIFFTLKYRLYLNSEVLGFLPVLSLCLYIIAYSFGLGPISWIIPSEIFRSNVKGVATSIAGSFSWFLAFLVTKFYLDVETIVGVDPLFYVFSLISLCGSIFVYIVLPETKGKSIEEIQNALG